MYQIGGPFLTTAVFCEEARQQEGFLSLFRIIDRIAVVGIGPVMPPTQLEMTLVVIFRSGSFRGRNTINLTQWSPSGFPLPLFDFPVFFQGGEQGAGVIAKVGFAVQEIGLHWFQISLGGQPVTNIPLTIVYQPTGGVTA
jgi:hypothetical protein